MHASVYIPMSITTIPNILFVVFSTFVVSTTLIKVIVLGAIGVNVTLFIFKCAWSEPRHGWLLFKDGKKIQNCCFDVYGHVCLSAQSFNFLAVNLFCNFQTLWPFLCKWIKVGHIFQVKNFNFNYACLLYVFLPHEWHLSHILLPVNPL